MWMWMWICGRDINYRWDLTNHEHGEPEHQPRYSSIFVSETRRQIARPFALERTKENDGEYHVGQMCDHRFHFSCWRDSSGVKSRLDDRWNHQVLPSCKQIQRRWHDRGSKEGGDDGVLKLISLVTDNENVLFNWQWDAVEFESESGFIFDGHSRQDSSLSQPDYDCCSFIAGMVRWVLARLGGSLKWQCYLPWPFQASFEVLWTEFL